MLLVVARVIKNQKKQKETSVSLLGKYNAIVKMIPSVNKKVVMRSVLVVKKVLGKS
jgi:hypothetical protein